MASSSSPSSSTRTASLLLLLQLGSRIVTFTLNQALLGFTTPAAFGTATIQLEPLLITVLFLSREGIRSALVRSSSSSSTKRPSSVYATSLIPLYLGTPLSIVAFAAYAHYTSSAVSQQPFFTTCVLLYLLATCTELASEPFFNRAQVELDVKLRVSVEGTAVIGRALVTLAIILYGKEKLALLAFGVGQQVYASVLLLRYLWHYRWASEHAQSGAGESSDRSVLQLAYAYTKQSFVKQLLTEGDKIIISRISPIEDQGGYGLALNYGSLVARILFQPLEESSRLFYSHNLPQTATTGEADEKSASAKRVSDSLSLLRNLIKLQIYLALIFTCFCPYYTTPLMYHVLGRSRWMQTSAPTLLRQYLYLLPLLGFNGIIEAFVQAVASERELGQMSYYLLCWSGIYCLTCYLAVTLAGLKEEALILANGVSMACRIAYSIHFSRGYATKYRQQLGLVPLILATRWPIFASVASTFVMRRSLQNSDWQSFPGFIKHVFSGAACFAFFLAAAAYTERHQLRSYLSRRAGQQKKRA